MSRRRGRIRKGGSKPSAPYRSKFEERIFKNGLLKKVDYEPQSWGYEYTEHYSRRYTPDGVFVNPTNHQMVWVELKGRFRTKQEAEKYIHVMRYNPEVDFFFVFMKKGTFMPRCKRLTQEHWAKENGLKFTFECELEAYMNEHYPKVKLK